MARTVHFITDDEWGKRKDNLGKSITWEKVFKKGIEEYEKIELIKEPENEPAYFILDKNPNVLIREFDMLQINMWITMPFDDIPLKAKFRVREDAKVIITEGHKEMIKLGERFTRNGIEYAEVLPV